MKTTITLFGLFVCSCFNILNASTIYSFQNNADWNNGLHWSTNEISSCNCTPDISKDDIVIKHTSTVNGNNAIGKNASIVITEAGDLTIIGNLEIEEDGELVIEFNGKARVQGGFIIHDGSALLMTNKDALLMIDGDFENHNADNNGVIVHGRIFIEGDADGYNNSSIIGTGFMSVKGDTKLNTGPQTSSIFGNTSDCFGGCEFGNIALPVELSEFKGNSKKGGINLSWTTASENNNDEFLLEKSTNGVEYEIIASFKGAGNSSTDQVYNHYDGAPFDGINYYRLKQKDFDGSTHISEAISIKFNKEPKEECTLTVYQQSSIVQFQIEIPATSKNSALLTMVDITGKSVFIKNVDPYERVSPISLPSGLYFVQLSNGKCKKVEKVYIN